MEETRLSALRVRSAPILLLLSVYFALVVSASGRNSPTFDEPAHLRAGLTMLSGGRWIDEGRAWWTQQDPMLPPSDVIPAAFAALSGRSADFRESADTDFAHIRAARFANHLIGAAVLLLLYCWFSAEAGRAAGAAAALAAAANPLFLAHATIVSTDLYMLLSALAASWFWWSRYVRAAGPPTTRTDLANGLLLGAAVAMKLTNLLFLVLLPAAAAVGASKAPPGRARLAVFARSILLSGLSALLLAAALYELTQRGVPKTVFESWPLPFGLGEKLANAVVIARGLHVIFPPVYWFGELQAGSYRHYLWMTLARTPLLLLLLWLLAAAALLSALRRRGKAAAAARYAALLSAAAAVFFATRGFYVGTRHLLYPIVLFSAASGALLASCGFERSYRAGASMLVLSAAAALSCAISWPWYLTFVNTLGAGELTFEADGDWGQGLVALREWQQESGRREDLSLSYFGSVRPELFGVSYRGMLTAFTPQQVDKRTKHFADPERAAGLIAISGTSLTGRYLPHAKAKENHYYRWHDKAPIAKLGGSIWLFDADALRQAR